MDKVFGTDITRLIVDDPVKRVDNMTMAWGLESRVPFMDTKLVEWALQLPPQLKMREEGKYPLKQISRGLLPDSVIDRKKGYFQEFYGNQLFHARRSEDSTPCVKCPAKVVNNFAE